MAKKATKPKKPDARTFRWRIAKAGYTESAAAGEIGISIATMSRVVRGINDPIPLTVQKIESWLKNKGV